MPSSPDRPTTTSWAPEVLGITPPSIGTARRWAVFVLGAACLIGGIGISITADLGVGSWQVLETGLVEATGASYGVVVVVEAAVAIAIAWAWLGQRPWIATVLFAFGGVGIGAVLDALTTPEALWARSLMLAVGMCLIAVGVAFYLASDLGASAQDALFVGIYKTYEVRPGIVRFAMDATLVVVGALLGGQFGVGTIAVTIVVPVLIEPALRVGHRLAATPPPAALSRSSAAR